MSLSKEQNILDQYEKMRKLKKDRFQLILAIIAILSITGFFNARLKTIFSSSDGPIPLLKL